MPIAMPYSVPYTFWCAAVSINFKFIAANSLCRSLLSLALDKPGHQSLKTLIFYGLIWTP